MLNSNNIRSFYYLLLYSKLAFLSFDSKILKLLFCNNFSILSISKLSMSSKINIVCSLRCLKK